MREPAMQAANVRATARAFSIPLRHIHTAIKAGALTTYSTGSGRRAVLLFGDVREWLRSRPTPRRDNIEGKEP